MFGRDRAEHGSFNGSGRAERVGPVDVWIIDIVHDGGHGQSESSACSSGKVHSQPPREGLREGRDDDLVVGSFVESRLDGHEWRRRTEFARDV